MPSRSYKTYIGNKVNPFEVDKAANEDDKHQLINIATSCVAT